MSSTGSLMWVNGVANAAEIVSQKDWERIIKEQQRRLDTGDKKLDAAAKAIGTQRQELLEEHTKLMDESISPMLSIMPSKRHLSSEEMDRWIAEHDELLRSAFLFVPSGVRSL